MSARIALALALLGAIAPACAAAAEPEEPAEPVVFTDCKEWDDWERPAQPFRIHANTYYVGTCGISSILITSPDGAVVIDSGTEAGAEQVLGNIERLGVERDAVEILLMSHEHFDHVGGMASLVEATGAMVVASPVANRVLRRGVADPADPQAGMHEPMARVYPARVIEGSQRVRLNLDAIILTPIATPGHTPGALSWQWDSCDDNGACQTIVYADSLSPVSRDDYHFSDHPDYVADYRASLQRLREVDCDILVTPHPSASDMIARAATGSFIGGMSCTQYADAIETRLDQRLAKERGDD